MTETLSYTNSRSIQAEINCMLARYDKYNGRKIMGHLKSDSAPLILKHLTASHVVLS